MIKASEEEPLGLMVSVVLRRVPPGPLPGSVLGRRPVESVGSKGYSEDFQGLEFARQ